MSNPGAGTPRGDRMRRFGAAARCVRGSDVDGKIHQACCKSSGRHPNGRLVGFDHQGLAFLLGHRLQGGGENHCPLGGTLMCSWRFPISRVALAKYRLHKEAGTTLEDRDSSDESIEDELDLVDEDEEELEADASEERVAEAGMTSGGFVMVPADDIEFEEDESGVAK